jgi:hypothetical protein
MEANYLPFRNWRFVEDVRARRVVKCVGSCALRSGASAWRQCLLRSLSQILVRSRFHHAALGLRHPRGLCDDLKGEPAGCKRADGRVW